MGLNEDREVQMNIDEIIRRYNETADIQFSGTVFYGNVDETLFAQS